MAVPVTFPMSATIAKGIGTGAGIGADLAGAMGTFGQSDEDRLAEIERMIEVGEFLSPEEEFAYFADIGTSEREAYSRGAGEVSAFDLGGGRFAAQQMAREEAMAERRGEAQAEMRKGESDARKAAIKEKIALDKLKDKERANIWQAILGGVGKVAGFAEDTAYRMGDARDAEDELLDWYEEKAGSAEGLTLRQQQAYDYMRSKYG